MFDFSKVGIQPGSCRMIVDVGANEGQFLFPALEYFRPPRSLSIEMLEDLASRLREDPRLATGGQHVVLCCAVGDRVETRTCLRSVFSPASSLLPINPQANEWYDMDLHQHPHGTVPVRTLDDICAEYQIDSIDVLKIDVQGYEEPVIRGAERILRRTANLIIEVEFVPVYEGQALAGEVESALRARGFRPKCYLSEYRAKTGELLHADALFQPAS